jgi:hypothetical protein
MNDIQSSVWYTSAMLLSVMGSNHARSCTKRPGRSAQDALAQDLVVRVWVGDPNMSRAV